MVLSIYVIRTMYEFCYHELDFKDHFKILNLIPMKSMLPMYLLDNFIPKCIISKINFQQ